MVTHLPKALRFAVIEKNTGLSVAIPLSVGPTASGMSGRGRSSMNKRRWVTIEGYCFVDRMRIYRIKEIRE